MVMEGSQTLRPLGMMEIIDRIFRLYRANFWLFCGIAAVVEIPFFILYNSSIPRLITHVMMTRFPELPTHGGAAPPNLGALLALGFFMLIAMPISGGALIVAISQRYHGRPARIGDSYGQILRRLPSFLLTLLIIYALWYLIMAVPTAPFAALLIPFLRHPTGNPPVAAMVVTGGLGFLVAFALMLILYSWLPFSTIAFVLEEKRYFKAIGRATFLLRPWFWAQVLLVAIIVDRLPGCSPPRCRCPSH